jgi:transposase
MDAITKSYDGDVQMIDTSVVRVHQHAAGAKKGVEIVAWAVLGEDLADRGCDAGAIRQMVRTQDAWANIPPKASRKQPICFSPHLYKARNLVERFSIAGLRCATISSLKTISPHPSSLLFDCATCL